MTHAHTTRAKESSDGTWGCAFLSQGSPCVAQRVCPTPTSPCLHIYMYVCMCEHMAYTTLHMDLFCVHVHVCYLSRMLSCMQKRKTMICRYMHPWKHACIQTYILAYMHPFTLKHYIHKHTYMCAYIHTQLFFKPFEYALKKNESNKKKTNTSKKQGSKLGSNMHSRRSIRNCHSKGTNVTLKRIIVAARSESAAIKSSEFELVSTAIMHPDVLL
jgi:hypothetical protein